MDSYNKKFNQARQRIKVIQVDMSQDLFNQGLFDQEKTILMETQKWSLVEKKVLRQKSRACWIDSDNSN
ncbi:hypothetical protein RDI58_007335 [Solanum bulbocastanum]|uniref:Uncharacterized protein n=1 Tax=Solanum bulbocastanum TaxID=147425 RepID=A0AAN8U0L4_SOLBU